LKRTDFLIYQSLVGFEPTSALSLRIDSKAYSSLELKVQAKSSSPLKRTNFLIYQSLVGFEPTSALSLRIDSKAYSSLELKVQAKSSSPLNGLIF